MNEVPNPKFELIDLDFFFVALTVASAAVATFGEVLTVSTGTLLVGQVRGGQFLNCC